MGSHARKQDKKVREMHSLVLMTDTGDSQSVSSSHPPSAGPKQSRRQLTGHMSGEAWPHEHMGGCRVGAEPNMQGYKLQMTSQAVHYVIDRCIHYSTVHSVNAVPF